MTLWDGSMSVIWAANNLKSLNLGVNSRTVCSNVMLRIPGLIPKANLGYARESGQGTGI